MRRLLIAALIIAGCRGSGDIAGAAIATAVALTASGVSRAVGGCYASCPTGTVCNEITGLCETLPCRGLCAENETCDESGVIAKCVNKSPDIIITNEKEIEPPKLQPEE